MRLILLFLSKKCKIGSPVIIFSPIVVDEGREDFLFWGQIFRSFVPRAEIYQLALPSHESDVLIFNMK